MSKNRNFELADKILQLVSASQTGLGLAGISRLLKGQITTRTLQRRIAELVNQDKLIKIGKSRAQKYIVQQDFPLQKTGGLDIPESNQSYLPLSNDSQPVLYYVRQHKSQRKVVAYNRNFLENYRPNHDFYINETSRNHLHNLSTGSARIDCDNLEADVLFHRFVIDLAWASSGFEGNLFTRIDTRNHINAIRIVDNCEVFKSTQIFNHYAAMEFLTCDPGGLTADSYNLRNLHALVSNNLLYKLEYSGRLRDQLVSVSGSAYRPLSDPSLIEIYFKLIIEKARQIHDAIEKSIFLLIHICYLQPFIDANKRVSRVAANIPLIHDGLCPVSFVGVPVDAYHEALLGIFEMNQTSLMSDVYVWAYERSCERYIERETVHIEPDSFGLLHREDIAAVIRHIIIERTLPVVANVRNLSAALVEASDLEAVVARVMHEFKYLNEGNISRFKIPLVDYLRWKKLLQA